MTFAYTAWWCTCGGVSPIGHLGRTRKWFDRSLQGFDLVWAAAGIPHHVFSLEPELMAAVASAEVAGFTCG